MIKDISKIKTWHIWKVTYLRRNVTIVCGASYHLLGSWISWDSKIRFRLQVESYISNWQFSKSWHLARYVSRHNAMAYDMWQQKRMCAHVSCSCRQHCALQFCPTPSCRLLPSLVCMPKVGIIWVPPEEYDILFPNQSYQMPLYQGYSWRRIFPWQGVCGFRNDKH